MGRPRKIPPVSQCKNRLDELKAMRRVVALKLDDEATIPRDIPPLVRRQMELGEAIEDLEAIQAKEEREEQIRSTRDAPFDLSQL